MAKSAVKKVVEMPGRAARRRAKSLERVADEVSILAHTLEQSVGGAARVTGAQLRAVEGRVQFLADSVAMAEAKASTAAKTSADALAELRELTESGASANFRRVDVKVLDREGNVLSASSCGFTDKDELRLLVSGGQTSFSVAPLVDIQPLATE